MLKRILLVVIAIVAAFFGYVAMQPSTSRIERSAIFVGPVETAFAEVNDFRNWQAWSPWAKLDPNAKATFDGPASGEGAKFHWDGNSEVGKGTMTITESKPNEHIGMRLDFEKPFAATSRTDFTFKPDGPRTIVTWAMTGESPNIFVKAMCLIMNSDKMVGDQFEKGLASLKKIVEAKSAS